MPPVDLKRNFKQLEWVLPRVLFLPPDAAWLAVPSQVLSADVGELLLAASHF
jgi:hypothetical protein